MSKRLIWITMVLLLSVACGKEQITDNIHEEDAKPDAAEYLFDDTQLPRLSICVNEAEWNRLLQLYDKDNHTHAYVKCDQVILDRGDATYKCSNVGLRLRGQTSRRRPEGSGGQKHKAEGADWHHVHFGLNCRSFADSGDIAGIRRINLKYAKEDPSYIREHYCMDLLSRYGVWTAPKSSWCRLYIYVGDGTPAYYGVYLMTESIDKRFVKRRPEFGTEKGWLWKCAWGANLRDKDDWRFRLDDNSSNTYAYELKEDDPAQLAPAKAQIKDFITKLNSLKGADFYNWIQETCDVDLLLKMYAALVALGHWDDYWNDMNNFYLYFSSQDPQHYKVYMLPYDFDNTLGTSHYCGVQSDSGRQNPYHWGLEECVLLYKILSVKDFREKYTEYLRDFSTVDNPWTGQIASASRIHTWQDFIGPFLKNDTGEDQELRDRPASWGNHSEYRLLEASSNNWFKVKAASLASWIEKEK